MSKESNISELMDQYDQAHHAGDGAALAAMFLDDAAIIPPGQPKFTGRAAIDEFYAGVTGGSQMKTVSTAIHVDQNMASVDGETSWQEGDQTLYLHFVNVLQLVNGTWKYKLLTWNTNEGYLKE